MASLHLVAKTHARLRRLCDDLLKFGDQLLPLLQRCLMLLLLAQQQILKLRLFISMLIYNKVVLGLESCELLLKLVDILLSCSL